MTTHAFKTGVATIATAVAISLFSMTSVRAQLIPIDPGTGVTASSEISTCCGDRDPADIVNGSGLAGGLHNVTPGNMWLSTGTGFGGVDPDPFVMFDLGDVYNVSGFHVWNYNEVGAFSTRGVNAVSIEYGNTAALGSTLAGISNFAQAPGANGYAGEAFDSFAPFEARFIKFDIDTNHGDVNSFYGLSEVQFSGVLASLEQILGVTATASSELTAGVFNRVAGNVVDNVGSDTTVPDGAVGDPEGMWLSTGNGIAGGTPDPDPEIVFDLGGIEKIIEMHVFNYNENSGNPGLFTRRGVNELEILVSNDNFGGDIRSLGTFNLTQADGLAGLTPDVLDLGGVEAQYVKFDIISSHGGDNEFVGLNEVRFFRSVIPEPHALAIWSLLGLGFCQRRRTR